MKEKNTNEINQICLKESQKDKLSKESKTLWLDLRQSNREPVTEFKGGNRGTNIINIQLKIVVKIINLKKFPGK